MKSLLFKPEMVNAILNGRKTQTRRSLKPQPPEEFSRGDVAAITNGSRWAIGRSSMSEKGPGAWPPDPEPGLLCPYGQPGDSIYIKETFFAWGRWETRFNKKKGRDEWHFVDMTRERGKEYLYAADGVNESDTPRTRSDVYPRYWKRPSIFMPRTASRITLEITDVRVERLKEISREDALAEGIDRWDDTASVSPYRNYRKGDPGEMDMHCSCPERSFMTLWQSINGPESWDSNPWVWVVEFRRIP